MDMGTKKPDKFDSFIEKQFSVGPVVKIEKPSGGGRSSTFEERRSAAAGASVVEPEPEAVKELAPEVEAAPDAAVAEVQGAKRPAGRPVVYPKDSMVPMNFLIPRELKQMLEQLKLNLYRSSLTDLVKEAIRDLLIKYGVNPDEYGRSE